MDIELHEYRAAVAEIRGGKRVGPYVYLHKSALQAIPEAALEVVEGVLRQLDQPQIEFNVIKLDTRYASMSLLAYEEFFEAAFPELKASLALGAGGTSSFRTYDNPRSRPVLHRKELLLLSDDPHLEIFSRLTEAAQQEGLFFDNKRIGNAENWNSLLRSRGLEVIGHRLRRDDGSWVEIDSTATEVLRYRTALKRRNLSAPVQKLYDTGFLGNGWTFLDYGCGRGDDVRLLTDLGSAAAGWDPHYYPENERLKSDVVNLGYVLNVIEEPDERIEALSNAFQLTTHVLCVSAVTRSSNYSGQQRAYKDGVLTSRGTFQKPYDPAELSAFVEDVVELEPTRVGAGIVFVLKTQEAEQQLANVRFRRRRTRVRSSSYTSRLPTSRPAFNWSSLDTEQQQRVDSFWSLCLSLARVPGSEELDKSSDVSDLLGSPRRAFAALVADRGSEDVQAAREARKKELLVELALSFFDKRTRVRDFPASVQLDIREFFGGIKRLREEAKSLLFSIADVDGIHDACANEAGNGKGYLDLDHSLTVHVSELQALPPLLRVYVGCAERLFGQTENVDLVKIHIQSGKVSFLSFDNFSGLPIPRLLERVKVSLWSREVEFFDYIGPYEPPPLFFKSLYLQDDFEDFGLQEDFDRQLSKLKLTDHGSPPRRWHDFLDSLNDKGYRLDGFQLMPRLDAKVGRNFVFRDFIECGETYIRKQPQNIPDSWQTYDAIRILVECILDPVREQFGEIRLSYGFAGPNLTRCIERGIAPKLDQHASYERNEKGSPICDRGGIACDFDVPGVSSMALAQWVVQNTDFDRIYYYGADSPIHVSIGPERSRKCIIVERDEKRVRPKIRTLTTEKFLDLSA